MAAVMAQLRTRAVAVLAACAAGLVGAAARRIAETTAAAVVLTTLGGYWGLTAPQTPAWGAMAATSVAAIVGLMPAGAVASLTTISMAAVTVIAAEEARAAVTQELFHGGWPPGQHAFMHTFGAFHLLANMDQAMWWVQCVESEAQCCISEMEARTRHSPEFHAI